MATQSQFTGGLGTTISPSKFTPPTAFEASKVAQAGPSQGAITAGLSPFLQGQPGQGPLTQAAIERFKIETLPILEGQVALAGQTSSPALADLTGRSLAVALPQFIQADLDNRFKAAEGLQAQQRFGLEGAVASGKLAQEHADLGVRSALGLGQLGVAQRAQTAQEQVQNAQQRLAEEIQRGNLVIGQRGIELREKTEAEQLQQSAAQTIANISNQQETRKLNAARAAAELIIGFGGQVSVPLAELETQKAMAAINALIENGARMKDIEDAIETASQAERDRIQRLSEMFSTDLFASGLGSLLGTTVAG